MFDNLKQRLQFSDGQFASLTAALHQMEIPAKTILLQEGEIAKKIFFIEEGCLRAWFNNDGKDLTFQFFFEGETVSSIESFKKEIPSMVNIESIEPSKLWYISKNDLDKLLPALEAVPELRTQFIDNLFERMFLYMKHFFSFIKDTPLQRYKNLMQEKPVVIQRVPQHYIASYLGVSTVHLSRIKSQLAREKK